MINLSLDISKTKAILIGISDYQYFPEIKPAKNNVEDLAYLLIDKSVIGLPPQNILLISNKLHNEIAETIYNFLLDPCNADTETLIFYYAGHGYREAKSKELYLTGVNSKKTTIKLTAIPFSDIKEQIEYSQIQNRIIIIDACHSGLATMDSSEAFYTESELDIKGTYIITATAGNEQALFDPDKRNTYFSEELINIMKNGTAKSNEYISLDDLYHELLINLNHSKLPNPQRKTNLNALNFYFLKNKKFDKQALLENEGDMFYEMTEFEIAKQKYMEALAKKENKRIRKKLSQCEKNLELIEKRRIHEEFLRKSADEKQRQVEEFNLTHKSELNQVENEKIEFQQEEEKKIKIETIIKNIESEIIDPQFIEDNKAQKEIQEELAEKERKDAKKPEQNAEKKVVSKEDFISHNISDYQKQTISGDLFSVNKRILRTIGLHKKLIILSITLITIVILTIIIVKPKPDLDLNDSQYSKTKESQNAIMTPQSTTEQIAPQNANVNQPSKTEQTLDNTGTSIQDNSHESKKSESERIFQDLIASGKLKYNNKNFQGAIDDYSKAILQNANNADAYFYRGNAKANLKNYQAAILDYSKAISLNANFTNAFLNRGHAKYYLEDYNGTITDMSQVLALDPKNNDAYYWRGFSYFATENYSNAVIDFNKVININPNINDYALFINFAFSYQKLENFTKAIQFYNKGLAIKNDDFGVYDGLGYCYLDIKDYQNAIISFNKAIALNPNYVDALLGLALTYHYKGDEFAEKIRINDAKNAYPILNQGLTGFEKFKEEGYFYTASDENTLKKILYSKNY